LREPKNTNLIEISHLVILKFCKRNTVLKRENKDQELDDERPAFDAVRRFQGASGKNNATSFY